MSYAETYLWTNGVKVDIGYSQRFLESKFGIPQLEKRNFEEFIICRHPGERFSGIRWQQTMVNTLQVGEKVYDHLTVEVTAFKEEDWDQFMAELEGPFGRSHPDFDFEAFDQKNCQKLMRFTREFWFDITSFYGK